MTVEKKVQRIIAELKRKTPDPQCMLNYSLPEQLLIAARLSAQCTDKRVNEVTPELFSKFGDCYALAKAEISEIERIIKPCGLFKTKSKSIKEMCQILAESNGVIPDTMEELLKLPGVGRKTANLILGELFGKPAIVADTHVIRLSGRLGLIPESAKGNALKVEQALLEIIPPEESLLFCHRIVLHGRAVCKARNPGCVNCVISEWCAGKKSK
ncbi:MAG: endonuclease III [Oscillospiraceae bacterium]|nr:endonuclease III [Oscillospiraceae bacterium]